MESVNYMKGKQGRRPNAHPTIGGMETLGKKPISGLFSNKGAGKDGAAEKHGGSGGVGFGHKMHKDIGFEGKAKKPKAVGFKKK